jgi:hypothetical protein
MLGNKKTDFSPFFWKKHQVVSLFRFCFEALRAYFKILPVNFFRLQIDGKDSF